MTSPDATPLTDEDLTQLSHAARERGFRRLARGAVREIRLLRLNLAMATAYALEQDAEIRSLRFALAAAKAHAAGIKDVLVSIRSHVIDRPSLSSLDRASERTVPAVDEAFVEKWALQAAVTAATLPTSARRSGRG